MRALWNMDVEEIPNILHCVCTRHAFIQCKIMQCTYYTNARLSKIYNNVSLHVNQCQCFPANHMYLFGSVHPAVTTGQKFLTLYQILLEKWLFQPVHCFIRDLSCSLSFYN